MLHKPALCLAAVVFPFASLLFPPALAQAAPSGWTTAKTESGILLYTPADLKPGEVYSVAVFPPGALRGKSLEGWLRDTAAQDSSLPGAGPFQVRSSRKLIVSGTRLFQTDDRAAAAIYTAVSVNGTDARLSRIVFTNGLFERYKAETLQITSELLNDLKGSRDGNEKPAAALPDRSEGRPFPATTAQPKLPTAGARYPWVMAPGKGLKPGQMAGVYHFYDVELTPGGVGGLNTRVTDTAYLLLSDGTLHKGLPVPPDQMDAALSKRREPSAWGRWRRQGGRIVASWMGGPLQPLPGKMAVPGTRGQRLQGRWGTGSSSADMTGGSYRLWGVTFTANGCFVKDGQGGYGNSVFAQTGGQPAINSTSDDQGSYTSASRPNFTVGVGRTRQLGSDRSGTYSISGYALTLRYDNGRVARLPFFFGDAAHETLWFEGAQLARDERKKL